MIVWRTALEVTHCGTETSLELRQFSQIEAGSKGEKFLSKKLIKVRVSYNFIQILTLILSPSKN